MMTTMGRAPGSASGSLPQHYPSLPASPTLTNPDMILPDYDRSSSPAGLDDLRAQSPLTMWKNAQNAGSGDLQHMYNEQSQQQFRNFPAGPVTPTTPIIYGNGTMLSDIGEVTEAESTPGKSSSSRRHTAFRTTAFGSKDKDSSGDAALQSSPTMGMSGTCGGIKKRAKENATQRERRSSMDSNSTITTQEQAALFADFDDSVSVNDSVFQGDDEESMASSYVDDSPVNTRHAYATVQDESGFSSGMDDVMDQRHSTASLSRRAEKILANAKRRLTTMEGNLSRARNSLAVTSPSSLSSFGSAGSTPSPRTARVPTAFIITTTDPSIPSPTSSHIRKGSDNSLRIGLPIRVHSQRSVSVLGVPEGYRQPLTGSKSADHLNSQYTQQRATSMIREAALAPLNEDGVSRTLLLGQVDSNDTSFAFASPTFGPPHERGLTRSASVAQMRDLKDQMKDLKDKISNLREQARADSMKRRSLQSLRTPSPFTHAQVDQWYKETNSAPGSGSGSGLANDNTGRNAWSGDPSPMADDGRHVHTTMEDDEPSATSTYEDINTAIAMMDQSVLANGSPDSELIHEETESVEDDNDDLFTQNGDMNEEKEVFMVGGDVGEDVYEMESESGESLYHDSVQQQLSHEDRADAFDYEHFFLHSAMGTLSQQKLGRRGSAASFSSEGSVETTRGLSTSAAGTDGDGADDADGDDLGRPRVLCRQGSSASISTIESFATADEGRSGRHGSSDSGSGSGRAAAVQSFSQQFSTTSIIEEQPESPPEMAKRATFGGMSSTPFAGTARWNPEEPRTSRHEFMYSTTRRPMSSSASSATKIHRPSVSSFDSTGTTRSFPLVNKAKKASSTGVLTPYGASPDQDLKTLADSLMSDTASICEGLHNGNSTTIFSDGSSSTGHKHSTSLDSASTVAGPLKDTSSTSAAIQSLQRDDQFLVERLVASLGRCVLGLTESGRASTESRMYRRRIDAARRILEGYDSI